jgi:uncharacterized protein
MTESPRVVVRGEAVAEVLPDAADLVVTIEVRDRRRDRALTALTGRQQELTAVLDAHRDGLGAVATDAVSVFGETTDGTRGGGSVATATTRVQVGDVALAGALAVAVAGLADTSLHGPHWRVSRGHPVHDQVRAAAVADALARARGYATALGVSLTGLVELRDAGTGGGGGRVARASLAAAAPQLELQPGPAEVHGSVEMTFTMSPPDQEVYAG